MRGSAPFVRSRPGGVRCPAPTPARSPTRRRTPPVPGWRSYPPGSRPTSTSREVPLTRLLDDAAASFPTAHGAGVPRARRSPTASSRDAVDHFASGLAGLGVRKGDRVAMVLPNCPQNVITVVRRAAARRRRRAAQPAVHRGRAARTSSPTAARASSSASTASTTTVAGVRADTARASSRRHLAGRLPAGADAAAAAAAAAARPAGPCRADARRCGRARRSVRSCALVADADAPPGRRRSTRRATWRCCSTPAARPARPRARCSPTTTSSATPT